MMMNLFFSSFITLLLPWGGQSAVIRDSSLLGKNSVPVLGRGFSRSSGSFYSSCMIVDYSAMNNPTFDYSQHTITLNSSGAGSFTTDNIVEFQDLVSYAWMDSRISELITSSEISNTFVTATAITVTKYYRSIKDGGSRPLDFVSDILNNGDFVTFFQVCGPSYVQSITRTGEILALFSYQGTSEVQEALERNINNVVSTDDTSEDLNFDLRISAKAVGMYLVENSPSLIINSLDQFEDFVGAALESVMNADTGLVSSIEIIDWANNDFFQSAARLPVESGGVGDSTAAVQASLGVSIRKFNLMSNSEHLIRLMDLMRKRTDTVASLQSCMYSVMNIRRMYDKHILANTMCTTEGDDTCVKWSVEELRCKILGEDSDSDVSESRYLTSRKLSEVRRFIQQVFLPCASSLSADDRQIRGGMIQTTHWASLPACSSKINCLDENSVLPVSAASCVPDEDAQVTEILQVCPPDYDETRPVLTRLNYERLQAIPGSTCYTEDSIIMDEEECRNAGRLLGGTAGGDIYISNSEYAQHCIMLNNNIYLNTGADTNGITNPYGVAPICKETVYSCENQEYSLPSE
mmetsp:Transcript_29886/g.68570  ORF Transcript_29886/g.68570 Transcript_29886/m.68570 type:complete len:578 (-) Transcript_29886:33-1766(-)